MLALGNTRLGFVAVALLIVPWCNGLTFFVGTNSEQTMLPPRHKLSEEELRTVYDFCRYLPLMTRKIRVTGESKEICARLVTLLDKDFV